MISNYKHLLQSSLMDWNNQTSQTNTIFFFGGIIRLTNCKNDIEYFSIFSSINYILVGQRGEYTM
jgi:hypothetical protein